MAVDVNAPVTKGANPLLPGSLRARAWKRFLRGPDQALLEELYVPALGEAIRYDRCCAYFSSSVLSAAARGFGRLIERLEAMGEAAPRPAVRLVVNEYLEKEDVRALLERGDLSRLEEALARRFKTPTEALEKQRLGMLGWLAQRGLLEIRVGVLRQGGGILHGKYGIIRDEAGDAVVFNGSGNETAQALLANYERLEVSTSWGDAERLEEYATEFEHLWTGKDQAIQTFSLPEAVRLSLIKFAPKEAPVVEPSTTLARQKAAMLWQFIAEAPYLPNGGSACDDTAMIDLWPHQRNVAEETAGAWPAGRLLCDEVGMGKTIEAIAVLRRLMAGRGVRRVLFLLPAGLVKQWQAELREKGGLVFPRLEGLGALVWPDGRSEELASLAQALDRDVLLMSRETARLDNHLPAILSARPWDLVILDEAHAARRRQQAEGEFNRGTLLLDLLRQLQLRRQARGILLLSATPMQTNPWEPWDLLGVLGEGGRWLADFSGVRDFYDAIAAVKAGTCDRATARKAASMICHDPGFPTPPGSGGKSLQSITQRLAFPSPSQRPAIAQWLRDGSPLARRMHRNTRRTLLRYYEKGLLKTRPPVRQVKDVRYDYEDRAEREAYDAVGEYIDKRFEELEKERPGKGFVMTVYRRRASSSPRALEKSLERRREGLRRVAGKLAYDPDFSVLDAPESLDASELPEVEETGKISAALPSESKVAEAEMKEVDHVLEHVRGLGASDSKRDRFVQELKALTNEGRSVLVFTEYVDTMEYLRDALELSYGDRLGCYSGGGGRMRIGEEWAPVTKSRIREALDTGKLTVLICTDAASEGLNLQSASAVINYDLPWNPSKVEQRIGRVDRIGQKAAEVRVVNLFLKDSIDDRVYHVLRVRCQLFEQFVGAMQPVLALARRMLIGKDPFSAANLTAAAVAAGKDTLAQETYFEGTASAMAPRSSALNRDDLVSALPLLTGDFGPKASAKRQRGCHGLTGPGLPRLTYACNSEALEANQSALPLSPLAPGIRQMAEGLRRAGEQLPLVVGSYESGAFRRSLAYWLGAGAPVPVESMAQLKALIEAWNGALPGPSAWTQAAAQAQAEAKAQVEKMQERTAQREAEGLRRQLEAARIRLARELGRFLFCWQRRFGGQETDPNQIAYGLLQRDSDISHRLHQCLERLGCYPGYPAWDGEMLSEVQEFVDHLAESQVLARIGGMELGAALADPRWLATG